MGQTEAEFKEFEPRRWTAQEPPITGSNLAPAQISKLLLKFPAEPTMFKPRLLFEPRLDMVKIL